MKTKVIGALSCLAVLLAVGAMCLPKEHSRAEQAPLPTERGQHFAKTQTVNSRIESPSQHLEKADPARVNLTQRQEAIISLQVGLLDKMAERALKSKNERLFAIVQAEKAKVIGTARLLGE